MEKKQKRNDREAIVEKLTRLKQEATRDRKKLSSQKVRFDPRLYIVSPSIIAYCTSQDKQ